MKNYEEITSKLLERKDRYEAEQKRKRKYIIGTAATLCCCGLVAVAGIGIWQRSRPQNEPPVISDTSDANGHFTESTFSQIGTDEPTQIPVSDNLINIQQVEKLPDIQNEMLFALMMDDCIEMDGTEICKYYGVNIFPAVPDDLKGKEEPFFAIYKRKQTDELYWDTNSISYTNEDFSRYVCVGVDKSCMPFDFLDMFSADETRSVINGIEVGIAQTSHGDLYAEFMYKDVGFRVVSNGLSENEFITVIASLIE